MITEAENEDRRTKVTRRVEALLAKAESTTSVEEAELFFAKAEELMLKYSIHRAQMNADPQEAIKVSIISIRVPFTGAAQHFWKSLGCFGTNRVVHAMGLVQMAAAQQTHTVHLYGTADDCFYTEKVLLSLWRQANVHFKLWKSTDSDYRGVVGWGDKKLIFDSQNSYMLGFCAGFAARIEEARTAVLNETPGAELVLASQAVEISRRIQASTHPSRMQNLRAGITGYEQGYDDGHSAVIGNEVER